MSNTTGKQSQQQYQLGPPKNFAAHSKEAEDVIAEVLQKRKFD